MNSGLKRVLCVGAAADTSSEFERALSREFDCTATLGADAAMAAFELHAPFPVVITNHRISGADGVELLRQLRHRWPDTVGVLVSGMDTIDAAITALHEGNAYRYVREPWTPEEILRATRDAMEYFRLVQNERQLRDQLARTNAELDEKIQDLDEANELLEYWVEFSPAVLYSISCEDGVLHPSYISKNFHRLTGYERTAAVVDPDFWGQLLHADDQPRFREALASLVAGDDTHRVLEYRVRHRAGNLVTVVDSMRAVRDAEGGTVELVGAWMDVSARN